MRIKTDLVTLTDQMEVGQGNEAYIFKWKTKAVKSYKSPSDPSYSGMPNEANERSMAKERLKIVQTKLPEFPTGLPKHMTVPEELGYDPKTGKISGYVMPFLEKAILLKEYTSPSFRSVGNIGSSTIIKLFKGFKPTVRGVHDRNVVLADFTIFNNMVMPQADHIQIVDADAAQFGKYLTKTFTARYVDPRLCDPKQTKPMLIHQHDQLSDWYAYDVMLFECLMMTHPVYGGTYKAKGANDRIRDEERGLKRVTIFHPQVRYPKMGVGLDTLPKQVKDYFYEVFVEDRRGEFPDFLFDVLTTGRPAIAAIPVNQQLVVIRGKVTATQEFVTRGMILYSTIQNGRLKIVYHEDGEFKREDRSVLATGIPDAYERFAVKGEQTIRAKQNQMTTYFPFGNPQIELIDSNSGNHPQIDANSQHNYWIKSGQLYHEGPYGEEFIADVFSGQTQFWVGPEFGFGFYRASGITVGFVFHAEQQGMNDQVKIPPISGQLLASNCVFNREYAWFFYTVKEGIEVKNYAIVIARDGSIKAKGHTIDGDGSWLSNIKGKCAVGNMLFAPTDGGVVKVEIVNEELVQTELFPDTEPFVTDTSFLLPGPGGLYAISNNSVYLLKIQ